ncbi:MAG: uroporphyrinogen decarboxylase family protein [Sphaerochaetaceae bacterium]|nr:uroporphyrinogen decarboxylase family protein [Sphaerochaetaceae bacterium]
MKARKDLVIKALNCQEVERIPWVPFTGVQCAKLLDMDAETFLRSPENIVKGVKLAAEKYLADGVCSVFDLQIEAEALGCGLKWSKNNPPAVATHVLETKELDELPEFTKESGRIADALKATKMLKDEIGENVAIFGLICGPFTLALHLAGASFLTDMIEYPDKAKAVLDFCAETARKMSAWYIEAGADVVALVDPMTSQISPRHFKRYVMDTVAPSIEEVKSKGGIVTLFCCGDATKNIELMMQCQPNGIAFDEQVSIPMCRELSAKYNVAIEGNLHLTTTLLFGNPTECVEDARRCMEEGGNKGFILSPGCDLPFDTPYYNLEAVGRFAVLGEEPSKSSGFLSLEEALTACDAVAEGFDDVVIEPGKIFVEVVTLDSEGCAPCQYMMESLMRVKEKYGDRLTYRETLIKSLAGIKRVQQLGCKNLPSMLINNELVFDNIIPTDEELIKELDKRSKEK